MGDQSEQLEYIEDCKSLLNSFLADLQLLQLDLQFRDRIMKMSELESSNFRKDIIRLHQSLDKLIEYNNRLFLEQREEETSETEAASDDGTLYSIGTQRMPIGDEES